MNGFSQNPEIITPHQGAELKGLIFQEKVFPVDLPPACFGSDEHTRARCSLPAGGAVYPTQDSPVSNFSDATAVELSEYSNSCCD